MKKRNTKDLIPQSWTAISSCSVAQAVWIFGMSSFVF